jgi:predicted DNA-binding transcriptional regulator AlpA
MTPVILNALSRTFMRGPAVMDARGCRKTRLNDDVRDGTFPPPIRDGTSSRWLSDEVEAMLDFIVANPAATKDDKRAFVAELIAKRPQPRAAA